MKPILETASGDHEPADVAEVLWRHHTERSHFQVRVGID